jgi:hypothetical protein
MGSTSARCRSRRSTGRTGKRTTRCIGRGSDLIELEIIHADVQAIAADALLVPVDGVICRLGGAAASAIRASLPAEERVDELEYVEDMLARLRPLPTGGARAIEGVGRWRWLVISAAYPHNVDGRLFSATECAAILRSALPEAVRACAETGARSVAMTVIGTAYRMPGDVAVRAQVDGLAAAADVDVRVLWAFREAELVEVARAAAARVGLLARSVHD